MAEAVFFTEDIQCLHSKNLQNYLEWINLQMHTYIKKG